VSTIVKMLDLGPGEWVYDESGKMVRKDT
jgi:hypothetical protein